MIYDLLSRGRGKAISSRAIARQTGYPVSMVEKLAEKEIKKGYEIMMARVNGEDYLYIPDSPEERIMYNNNRKIMILKEKFGGK